VHDQFVLVRLGQRGQVGTGQFRWHPGMMNYPPCVYNSFLPDSFRLNSYEISLKWILDRFC
jgi:hypothetical protein